jgi:hypothetical protein
MFTIQKLPQEPILIVHEMETYSPLQHIGQLIDAVLAQVEQFERPGYAVWIMKKTGFSFNEILEGAALVRDKGEALRNHPMYRGTLFVTTFDINKSAISGMSYEQLGKLFYHVFDSEDEALVFARAHL